VTKTDSHPIPRIDYCIDHIGLTRCISKFDLLKGYWQVPLTERAKEVSAFVTPDGFSVLCDAFRNEEHTSHVPVNDQWCDSWSGGLRCIHR